MRRAKACIFSGCESRPERGRSSRSQAERRVWIPQPDGQHRPLGIPALKDRVVQTAAVLVLEPIFEADLPPEQYAYRPERSALDAVRKVPTLLTRISHQRARRARRVL